METAGAVEPVVEPVADVGAPTGDIITDNSISDSGGHWLDTFQVTPEQRAELENHPGLQVYKTGYDFIKSSLEREKLLGQKQGIEPLGDEASIEDRQAWYRNLPGQPNTPQEYGVQPPTAPEGMPVAFDEHVFQGFLDLAHQWGVPSGAVDAIVRYFEHQEAQNWQTQNQKETELDQQWHQEIKTMWGPLADQNMTVVMESIRRAHGLEWLEDHIATDSMGNTQFRGIPPQFAKIAHEWAVSQGHDRFVAGNGNGVANVQQATQQLNEARQQFARGEINESTFRDISRRLSPIVYHKGQDGEDLVIGNAMTAVDFEP